MDALVAQVWAFMPVVRQFTIKSCLFVLRHALTHIDGGAASWDSNCSEKISRPGLHCSELSGFRGIAWVCEFQSTQNGVNACKLSPEWLRRCCKSLRVQVAGPRRNHTIGTDQSLSTLCCQVFSARSLLLSPSLCLPLSSFFPHHHLHLHFFAHHRHRSSSRPEFIIFIWFLCNFHAVVDPKLIQTLRGANQETMSEFSTFWKVLVPTF